MSRPLTHRPFAELEPPKPEVTVIRRRTTDPESGLSLVRQIRATPLPTDPPPNARLAPDPSEPEPVAAKKKKPGKKGHKRSPESIAKMKATIAAKKARGEPVGAQARLGKKATLPRKKKGRRGGPIAMDPALSGGSISDLLQAIIDATAEIQRRLSQLTL